MYAPLLYLNTAALSLHYCSNRKLTIIVKYLLDFETFRTLTGFENANVVFSLSFLKILELSI